MGKTLDAIADSLANSLLIGFISSFAVNVGINSRGGNFGLYDTIIFGAGVNFATFCVQFPLYYIYYANKEKKNHRLY